MRKNKNPVLAATKTPITNLNNFDRKPTTSKYTCKCPMPDWATPSQNIEWLFEFEMLSNRYPDLGIRTDFANFSIKDAWGHYLFLKRVDKNNEQV